MKESLTRALEELKAKGHEGDLPAPDMVAQRIEATMFKHFGASFLLPTPCPCCVHCCGTTGASTVSENSVFVGPKR